jgi:dTDP-4-amino-4,6-dideoxygalactose transaminase
MPAAANRAASRVLRSGYLGEGPVTKRFERELSAWLEEEHVAVVDSCTSALGLALHLADVGSGCEVISSPLTCVAANTAILRRGATIRWADVDPGSGNLSAESVERRITLRTKAIVFTDWGGVPADARSIGEVARRHGLPTIQDAASAIGVRVQGRPPSTAADYVCYSFQAVKHLTTINGGALVARDATAAERARLLRWYGLPRFADRISMADAEVDLPEAGYKMHLNDVSSAIGLVQLRHIDGILREHRRNAAALRRILAELRHFSAQGVIGGTLPSDHYLTVVADSAANRETLSQTCQAAGIATSIVHRRNDVYSAFKDFRTRLPGVDWFSDRALALPTGWWLTAADVRRIARTIREVDKKVG